MGALDHGRIPTHRLMAAFTSAAQVHVELTCRQMAFLCRLATDGGKSTAYYAEKLGVSKPAITRACDRLSVLGLCHRKGSDFDRRQVVLTITSEGRALLEKVASAQVEG
ncbi:MarR family transcriptional regulator [Rhodovarius crocodyli]|uniref:MarR family transcriptional regulator n=1 Tax=Rhodovarius crocodyli TaxID=1979269 RepID=A0A437MEW2_9PROT|nr:MarR family transcriptional regulator [Rhodovarius crocodyli]RVT96194.1 MarR family transcriptional regulator [Rhodovarius crocodyli]